VPVEQPGRAEPTAVDEEGEQRRVARDGSKQRRRGVVGGSSRAMRCASAGAKGISSGSMRAIGVSGLLPKA
jgi:hypothetical protein